MSFFGCLLPSFSHFQVVFPKVVNLKQLSRRCCFIKHATCEYKIASKSIPFLLKGYPFIIDITDSYNCVYVILYHIISYYIIVYHSISYYIIVYHIISLYIIVYHIISYYIILNQIISYYIILFHIISLNIISYYIILYHIISYYIILNHIISY